MSELPVKVIGRRRLRQHPEAREWNDFFKLAGALRPIPWMVPKGVYRFASFEEAQQWMDQETIKTLRRNIPGNPRSTT